MYNNIEQMNDDIPTYSIGHRVKPKRHVCHHVILVLFTQMNDIIETTKIIIHKRNLMCVSYYYVQDII